MKTFRLFQIRFPDEKNPNQKELMISYHAQTGKIAEAVDAGFCHEIARVQASDINDVYRLTNSIHEYWGNNLEVEMISGPSRSTMTGDLVLDVERDAFFLCANLGWEQICPLIEAKLREMLGLDPGAVPALAGPGA